MCEPERIADEQCVVAARGLEMRRVVEEVRMSLEVIEVGFARHVADRAQVIVCDLPRVTHLVRVEGAAADVDPIGLRHVPAIPTDSVEQDELRLAVASESRAFDRDCIGLELELLHADGPPWAYGREESRDGTVGAAGTDQIARANLAVGELEDQWSPARSIFLT